MRLSRLQLAENTIWISRPPDPQSLAIAPAVSREPRGLRTAGLALFVVSRFMRATKRHFLASDRLGRIADLRGGTHRVLHADSFRSLSPVDCQTEL